ncbi:MAG: M23 family metallopeptidase [Prevotella sp.]|nr:M23 family metallopeptidase [Prevotella sp.]
MKLRKITINLLIASFLLCATDACAQRGFTAAEQQQISITTPGLFERSNAFTIDFSNLKDNDYSFPLPVGKAKVNNNNSMKITTKEGDAVKAMFDGKVRLSRRIDGWGNVIVIRHNNGIETVYANNAQNMVKVNQNVKAGQTIAIVGEDGGEYYCSFSIMVNGGRINPATLLGVKTHKLYKQTVLFTKKDNHVEVAVEKGRQESIFGSGYDPFENSNTFKLDLAELDEEEWSYPLPNGHVISPYGGKRNHAGVDIKTFPNDKIVAAFSGEVTLSGPHYAYGNCIVIKHGWGLETLYSHQSKNLVKVGDKVKAGDVIGLTGRTGRATTEHLHFEIHYKNQRFNPNVIFNHSTRKLQERTITFKKNGGFTTTK